MREGNGTPPLQVGGQSLRISRLLTIDPSSSKTKGLLRLLAYSSRLAVIKSHGANLTTKWASYLSTNGRTTN